MKQQRKVLSIFLLLGLCTIFANGQQTIPASGGNASGSAGSVSYSIGQTLFNTITGSNGTIAQGVQQPYEISVVTAIGYTDDVTLQCSVYPNPTTGLLKLLVESDSYENMSFRLYDISGMLLQDKIINNHETEISLKNLNSTIYFLKVVKNNQEIKVFKIIKK
jgi:hypothetical protein